jgi:AcrR family transcriptional regulator
LNGNDAPSSVAPAKDSRVSKAKSASVRAVGAVTDDPRREVILNAAFALLMQRGYERTSTLDIATRAKVSKRELYQFFDSKQAILTACIAARAERMRRPLALPAPQDREALLAVLTGFGSTFLRELCQPAVVAVYRLAAIEAERSPEVARALDSAGRETNRKALIDFVGRAQSSGLLEAGDPAVIASDFFALVMRDLPLRLVLRVTEPPKPEEIDRRARAAAAALLRLHGKAQS